MPGCASTPSRFANPPRITSRLAAVLERSRLLGETLNGHLSQPVGVLAESGLQLRKGGFVVVPFRAGDLRAQITYAVVNATGWHTIECYRVSVGYHTHFYVELFDEEVIHVDGKAHG